MTREEILAMKPGQELDALVAERVMGYSDKKTVYQWADRKKKLFPLLVFALSTQKYDFGDYGTFINENDEKIQYGKPHRIFFPPKYSTVLTDAWQIVREVWPFFQLTRTEEMENPAVWYCAFSKVDSVKADSAPEAICKAALLAVLEL